MRPAAGGADGRAGDDAASQAPPSLHWLAVMGVDGSSAAEVGEVVDELAALAGRPSAVRVNGR
jgi:hypothetical protein